MAATTSAAAASNRRLVLALVVVVVIVFSFVTMYVDTRCINMMSSRVEDTLESASSSAASGVLSQLHDDGRIKNIGTSPSTRQEVPYGEFCETKPMNELQSWNTRKKVISFSLFVPQSTDPPQPISDYFVDGMVANVRLSQLYFPEWLTRIYTFNLSEQQIRQLIDLDPRRVEVVKCHDGSVMNKLDNARRMISRFLVVDDPTVEYAIVRDVDSRPSIRDLLAINEWISSGLAFHTIRDHRYHSVAVMGGMFGMKRGLFESSNTTMTNIVKIAFEDYPTQKIPGITQDDQNFLAKYIWPVVKDHAMDHDMDGGLRCRRFGSKVCRRFPIGGRDDESHIGYPFNSERNVTRATHFECTVSCRSEHYEEYADVLESNQR